MMILNLSESLAKPLVMAKLNMAWNHLPSRLSWQNWTWHRITCQAACHGKTEHGMESLAKPLVMAKLNMAWNHLPSRLSWQNWTWHGITCQAACHGKTEHGMESLAKPLVIAKLNMAYLSSLKNRAKLLLSSLPVLPSRVLRAPGTSSYHLVAKHLRATWPRPEQSHLLPEACSPNGTDNRQQRQRQTERPPPEQSDILKRFNSVSTLSAFPEGSHKREFSHDRHPIEGRHRMLTRILSQCMLRYYNFFLLLPI